jgi:hypothetical protein
VGISERGRKKGEGERGVKYIQYFLCMYEKIILKIIYKSQEGDKKE